MVAKWARRTRLLLRGRSNTALPWRRELAGFGLTIVGLPLLTFVLVVTRASHGVSTALLLYLLLVAAVATIGGKRPAMIAAIGSPLLANWYLIPPLRTWHIGDQENVVALFVFVSVAAVISSFVSIVNRRSHEATLARREAEVLAQLAAARPGGDRVGELADMLRTAFGMSAVSVLTSDESGWRVEAVSGSPIPDMATADLVETIDDSTRLVLSGRSLTLDDRRVLTAFSGHLAIALRESRLRVLPPNAPKRWIVPTNFARRCCVRCRMICGRRSPRSRPPYQVFATPRSPGPRRPTRSSWPRSRTRPTG